MPAVTRRQYAGAAVATTTVGNLAAGGTSVSITAATGWPSTAGVGFFVVISPGTSIEEKCLATISGTTLTLTRAQDGTTAQTHPAGSNIYPVFSRQDADDANRFLSTLTTRGDLLTMGSGPDPARIAVGSANTVLKSNGTDPSWGLVVTANITDANVTTAKIADANVTTDKLADSAVTSAKLGNMTVDTKTADYTLVAGDRNKRIVMNSATAKAITVNTSVFAAGDVVWIHNINTGTCTITAGTATVTTASSLALAQWEGGFLYFTSTGAAIFFRGGGSGYGLATGGSSSTITDGGFSWTLLSFTTDGTLTVSTAGRFECLLIGGGGGSGHNNAGGGSGESTGGGAGGSVLLTTLFLPVGSYTIDVGSGGAGSTGGDLIPLTCAGLPSSIYDATGATTLYYAQAMGGAGGAAAWGNQIAGQQVNVGGASWRSGSGAGGVVASASPLCFSGGGAFSSSGNGAGGGAGAAGNGGTGTSTTGGAGGAGRSTTFTGASVTYGSGGSGGGNSAGTTGSAIGGGGGGRQNGTTGNGTAGNAGAIYVRFRANQ